MESTSQPGCIHVSAVTAELLGPGVPLVSTGGVEVKGKVGSLTSGQSSAGWRCVQCSPREADTSTGVRAAGVHGRGGGEGQGGFTHLRSELLGTTRS